MKYKRYKWKQSIQGYKHKKGFTLIELIVVMAIIAILVLLAAPRFLGRTEDALATQIKHDISRAETKVDEYLIRHERLDRWDSAVSIEHLNDLKEDGDLYARTGVVTGELRPGDYSQVPHDFVERTVNSALEGALYSDEEGNVYYHHENNDHSGSGGNDDWRSQLPDYYVQATDEDFLWVDIDYGPDEGGYWYYSGDEKYVILPDEIAGEPITNTVFMFAYGHDGNYDDYMESEVKGVASLENNIDNMAYMFYGNKAETLDLTYLDTSNVGGSDYIGGMFRMFQWSHAQEIILGDFFDTSSVVDMSGMFGSSNVESIDLTLFDTSSVTSIHSMFSRSKIKELDLSTFTTIDITHLSSMFSNAEATVGYARTQEEADRYNSSETSIPDHLEFVVKE